MIQHRPSTTDHDPMFQCAGDVQLRSLDRVSERAAERQARRYG